MENTLGKAEKLKSQIAIEQLFSEGKRIKSFPLQLIYLQQDHEGEFPVKVGFSVPKRQIKLAVNRNKIKRRVREAYRKNKYRFIESEKTKFLFMIIYNSNKETDYETIEASLCKIASKFLKNNRDYVQI